MAQDTGLEADVEVFVRGHTFGRNLICPREASRQGNLWLIRDVKRSKPRYLHLEEWVALDAPATDVDRQVRAEAAGPFVLTVAAATAAAMAAAHEAYRALGYRLLRREGFFRHSLASIPSGGSAFRVERLLDRDLALKLARVMRIRPLPDEILDPQARIRTYVALEGDEIIGWVRSIAASGAFWCDNLFVGHNHRRRGVATALMARVLADDRALGGRASVLAASKAGAGLYPGLGYERTGTLLVFMRDRKAEAA